MSSIRSRHLFLIGIFLLFVCTSLPHFAHAQYSGSSGYRSKVNKLDDDIVKNLPVPILFGVPLTALTPNFGDDRDGGARSHEGLDIMAPKGAPIISPTEAVVIRTGNGSGSGKYVTTANPGGENFVYMHLDEVLVKAGQVLKPGALIGYVGNTGNAQATVPHLHFEIRKSRKALDPFERITKEYSLKDKLEFLEAILKTVKDEDELIDILTKEYVGTFYQARAQGLTIPKEILSELPKSAAVPTADLEAGADGSDVMALQSILIQSGYLKIEAPTGYFGPVTESALRAYQNANGILPSTGYFGAATRAHMLKGGGTTATPLPSMTTAEMEAKIAELTLLIKKLQSQI